MSSFFIPREASMTLYNDLKPHEEVRSEVCSNTFYVRHGLLLPVALPMMQPRLADRSLLHFKARKLSSMGATFIFYSSEPFIIHGVIILWLKAHTGSALVLRVDS